MRKDLKVEDLGKIAQLQDDGSPIQLGASGSFDGRSFTVLGRVQLGYGEGEGFWNEWSLEFADGNAGWLGEAQGLYAVSFLDEKAGALPAYESLKLGQNLDASGRTWEVKDLHEAAYLSAEGELPFKPPLGQSYPSADLARADGSFATIDYSETQPLLFSGRYVEFDDLSFRGLRKIEGW